MAIICPTVTAEDPTQYKEQIERLLPFAARVHLDFMDGLFTSNQSVALAEAWRPDTNEIIWDLHLMFMRPDLYLKQAARFKPALVVVQAEAKGKFDHIADTVHGWGSKVGVALLQDTPVSAIAPAMELIDHVLIFSGNLGHFGGKADLSLLGKVAEIRRLKSTVEVAWDGGINDENAKTLIEGGIDILNVGGYIQRSDNPAHAYATLEAIAEKAT